VQHELLGGKGDQRIGARIAGGSGAEDGGD